MNIVWRTRARNDLLGLVAHIARDSPRAAYETHDRILRAVDLLEMWPELGRQAPRLGVRELVVAKSPYIVIYRVEKDALVVLRIWHGKRRRN